MTTAPVDPRLAMEAASTQDLAQRKLAMDNLRHRLGDTRTKEEKLRESCEGFEAIFVQKMWEQMRKNVKKEGYLHSKDEEFYQSLFDQELAKKMTSAGGIGLADMLEQQLTQRLNHSSRHTVGSLRTPVTDKAEPGAKMSAEDLYSPATEAPQDALAGSADQEVHKALAELEREQQGDAVEAVPPAPAQSLLATMPSLRPSPPAADADRAGTPPQPMPGRVTAPGKARPVRRSASRAGGLSAGRRSAAPAAAPARSAAMQPPQAGEMSRTAQPGQAGQEATMQVPPQGGISSGYGWNRDAASGARHWHSGVDIRAAEGQAVAAAQAGTVIFAGEQDGYGHLTVLEHADGSRAFYSNAKADGVSVGDFVNSGAKIAQVAMRSANPMDATEPHLHFELRRGELAVNPGRAAEAALSGRSAEKELA